MTRNPEPHLWNVLAPRKIGHPRCTLIIWWFKKIHSHSPLVFWLHNTLAQIWEKMRKSIIWKYLRKTCVWPYLSISVWSAINQLNILILNKYAEHWLQIRTHRKQYRFLEKIVPTVLLYHQSWIHWVVVLRISDGIAAMITSLTSYF